MENTLPTADIAAIPAKKLHRSVEERAMANYISDAGILLEKVRLSPQMAEVLIDHGFDDEEMANGMALQERAASAFFSRYETLTPEQAEVLETLNASIAEARGAYEKFRGIARACFQGLSDRVNLRVTGDMPDDLQRFMTSAEAGYIVGCKEPYTEKLSKRGYSPEKLGALLEGLDHIATLDLAHGRAEAENEEALAEASETYVELKEFMKELKGVIRTVFRRKPEVIAALGI